MYFLFILFFYFLLFFFFFFFFFFFLYFFFFFSFLYFFFYFLSFFFFFFFFFLRPAFINIRLSTITHCARSNYLIMYHPHFLYSSVILLDVRKHVTFCIKEQPLSQTCFLVWELCGADLNTGDGEIQHHCIIQAYKNIRDLYIYTQYVWDM